MKSEKNELTKAENEKRERLKREKPYVYRKVLSYAEKVKRGELGLKSGKGFYDYHGQSKEQIIEKRDRNLLKQLILFKQL